MLHVTNGDLLAERIRAAQAVGVVPEGDVLPWRDVLHEGPVPAVADDELRRVRGAFLESRGYGDARGIVAGFEHRDARFGEALAACTGLVLWFDGDLCDRLQLGQIAARLAGCSALLVEVDERVSAEPAALWGTRRQLPQQLAHTLAAEWQALLEGRLDATPWRLREELPWTIDGLSLSERLTLRVVGAGARAPHEIFMGQAALEQRPFLGDTWVMERLDALRPLIEVEGDGPLVQRPPTYPMPGFSSVRISLSAAGRRVLAGSADAVEVCGLDRWLGGVRLTAGVHLRWDPAAGEIVRYASPR